MWRSPLSRRPPLSYGLGDYGFSEVVSDYLDGSDLAWAFKLMLQQRSIPYALMVSISC